MITLQEYFNNHHKIFKNIIINITICFCFIIIISLCSGSGCYPKEGDAELTVINKSSLFLKKVKWRGSLLGDLSPKDTLKKIVNGIKDTPVGFDLYLEGDGTEYFTDEQITVNPGAQVTFIFTDQTKLQYFK